MAETVQPDKKIEEPPPYVPSIDKIFLDKLDERDRFLVMKLDQISQDLRWAIHVTITNYNSIIDLKIAQRQIEADIKTLKEQSPEEDRKLVRWARENVVTPAKAIGWIITALIAAAISTWVSNKLSGKP